MLLLIIISVIQQADLRAATTSATLWPLYLLLGVAYLFLILYVSHVKTLRRKEGITDPLSAQINSVHVQQFLANAITVLEAFRRLKDQMQTIPELNTAFPYRLREGVLDDEDLEAVIKKTARQTNISREEIDEYIQRNKNLFLKTQGLAVGNSFDQRITVHEILNKIEEKHPDFNGFEIFHEAQLTEIFKQEGLDVIPLDGLKVLSAIVEYKDKQGGPKRVVLVKHDNEVHQALREFVLAHEVGHWFAHLDNDKDHQGRNIDFYLHSFHDLGPFETEANKVAMIALFPTPYLSWREVFDELNEEYLFADFTKGMSPVQENLAQYMKAYIKRRIRTYRKYRQLKLQRLTLPEGELLEDDVQPLLQGVLKNLRWARLDENYNVVDANENYAKLFNLSRDELLAGKYNLVEHLTDDTPLSQTGDTLREMTRRQLEIKRKQLKPKFYFTRYKNLTKPNEESVLVTIYAFPITDKDKNYKGSFGVVTDVREAV